VCVNGVHLVFDNRTTSPSVIERYLAYWQWVYVIRDASCGPGEPPRNRRPLQTKKTRTVKEKTSIYQSPSNTLSHRNAGQFGIDSH
jgi:hypothetical protein